MKVLGISPLDKDATAAIVEDGKVLYAAGEERFSRVKQQDGFPRLAIQDALEKTGLRAEDIDIVAYPFLTSKNEEKVFTANMDEERDFLQQFEPPPLASMLEEAAKRVPDRHEGIHGLSEPNAKSEKSPLHRAFYRLAGNSPLSNLAARDGSRRWVAMARESFSHWESELEAGLRDMGFSARLKRMDHHLSHAANALYASGFERALCITLDGYGTGLAGSVSEGRDGEIHRLHGVSFPNSLGSLYEQVTSALGYRPGRHEGKIVGLASYGDPSLLGDVLLSRVQQGDGDFSIYQANNVYFARYLATQFPKIDVAAAYQYALEVVATRFVKYWVEKTGIDTVVLSGGVTANVKLNQRIFESDGVKNIFVYPNMGDGGCGTGAALYHSWPGGVKKSIDNAYFGPEFSRDDMESALREAKLDYTAPDNLAADVAKVIHEGGVVARFDGRMEYGPRALGNRSIMYHAREPEVNQWLNKRLGRTEFMPFAPVTLYEAREKYFLNIKGAEHAAEFMTITFDCTDDMKRDCPAAVHVDGTARPQLIQREVNPGYYDILKEYEKLSGISSLINTSFNMHEEPIVCSPYDAIRAFLDGNIDWLVLGEFLVKHPSIDDQR